MYYDANKTLSKQRLYNFVIGARGCGKTYGAKMIAIKRFLRTGQQFVYLRRYDTEMPASKMRNFFDDVSDQFPGHEFSSAQGLFRIDGKIAGWYFPLSKAIMLKSIPFPNVWIIIFDEFIIEVGVYHYLPNEVRTFLECYSTISRDRDIVALFLSNAITMTNPYFLYFNIKLEPGQTVKLTPFISIEIVQNNEFTEHIKQTKFGQMIAETDYGRYNIENQFLLDTTDFIEGLPARASYICTFIVQNKEYGYYVSTEENKWYISPKVDKTCRLVYALKYADHNSATALAHRSNPYMRALIDHYCSGELRFTTQETKNILSDVLRRMI